MPVTVYRSTDAGAPQLNGVAGSLITVLDAVLVNGYGSKPAAGWTKPFSGTNKAVYRNSAVSPATGTYFRIRDDGVGPYPQGSNKATLRGYETMTDVDTGVGAFPSLTQMPEYGVYPPVIVKSDLTGSAARGWTIIADERTCYLFLNVSGAGVNLGLWHVFGDIKSFSAADPYASVVLATSYDSTSHSSTFPYSTNAASAAVATLQQNNIPCKIRRSHTGASTEPYDCFTYHQNNQGPWGSSDIATIPYPSPVSNTLVYHRALMSAAGQVRGELRGILVPSHARPLTYGDTLSLNGRTYLVVSLGDSGTVNYMGQVFVDITGPW